MSAVSIRRATPSTQGSLATRKLSLATLAGRVDGRVQSVRRCLINGACRGFASDLAAAMSWRIERRSRELSGVEKLSLADVVAEVELHLVNGEQQQADAILAAVTEGFKPSAVPITSGSVIRVFDEHGQLMLRVE
ncbi:MAG: hypothetical protein LUO93_02125 [Methanomicrobiales archaeon]|nr:hypothetical protein [Methanomicrobiales archaeon]